MIILAKKIPAKYERIALEEYYKFYQKQNNKKDVINRNIKFTMDSSKLSDKDLSNKSLMDATRTLKNDTDKYFFIVSFDIEERMTSIFKILITREEVEVCDIIYTDYPTDLEKALVLNEIVPKLEEIASLNGQKIKISTDDVITYQFLRLSDFEKSSTGDKTVLLTKEVEKRGMHEHTLSRKQGKELN